MMWNGELNPRLEYISGIRGIDAYLREMTFRRKLLGCDPGEVQDFIAEVSRQYKAVIASLLSGQDQDALVQNLQASLVRVSQENAALGEWNKWYEQAYASLLTENELLRQENMAFHAQWAQREYSLGILY